MPDYRITAAKSSPGEGSDTTSLVEALIHRADDIANRYKLVSSNLPYRAFAPQLVPEDVSALAAQLGAAMPSGQPVPSSLPLEEYCFSTP